MNDIIIAVTRSIVTRILTITLLVVMWTGCLLMLGFCLGINWFFLRKGLVTGVAVMALLFGCANLIRPAYISQDTVMLQYDTIGNTWPQVVKRAQEICVSDVEVISELDNRGTKFATFRCVRLSTEEKKG